MIPHANKLIYITFMFSLKNVVSDDYKSSLTFVIDDTGSMGDDIDEVKLGVNEIFDTVLRHDSSQIENFLLVTFNDDGKGDRGVVVRANTNNRETFRYALNQINVHGGDDCPEYAMSGIKKALEDSLDRSYLYVFTDASAKDYTEFEEIKAIAQKKQSKVVFVLTGLCGDRHSADYLVYHGLAKATGGEVFHMKKKEVGKILEYVKTTVTARRATLHSETLPPGKHNMTFYADEIMGEITLSLASVDPDHPSVTITAPDGSDVWKKILLETDQVKVYSVDVTMPGAHTVEVSSKSESRALISARSGIDFSHGFSAFKLPSLIDTRARPPPGTKSHLSIKLNEGDIILHTIQILDMDDNVKLELPLEILNNETKFYTTPAFDPPNIMFKIAIVGYDPKTSSNITRMSSTPVESSKPIPGKVIDTRSPVVTIQDAPVINAKFDKPLMLVCNINGYPTPSVVWRNKNTGSTIAAEVSLKEAPYEYLSVYNIEKVQENATYECEAINAAGSDAKEVDVTTIVLKKFLVLDSPKRVQIAFDQEGEISCLVDAYPPAEITWYKNKTKLVASDNIEISGDNSFVTIIHATPADKGKYVCVAKNRDERKVIYKYVAVVGTESPEVDKEVSDIPVTKGTSVEIHCNILKGIPRPTISWYHASGADLRVVDEVYEWKDKERVVVPINGKLDAGNYMCEAKNDVGTDYHEIQLHLGYAPTIEKGVDSIKAVSGAKISIPCHATGGPTPHVTWYKNGVEITSSDKVDIFGDQTLRLVAQPSDSGVYSCKATNTLGTVEKKVTVEVSVPASIKAPLDSTVSVLVGDDMPLLCEAKGDPLPTIEWVYHSLSFGSLAKTLRFTEEVLPLTEIQRSDEGYYTCIATNTGGSMNFTYKVLVTEPPSIINVYPDKRLEAVEGDRVLRVPCEVTGSPKPTITWKKDGLNLALGPPFFVDEKSLIIQNVPSDVSGSYTCEAKNSEGNAEETYEVTVRDYPLPSPPTSSIVGLTGDNIEITCGAPHSAFDQLRWYKDGVFIKSGKLTLKNAAVSDSGNYTCRTGNLVRSVSSTTSVLVGSEPTFTTGDDDEDIELMEGPISLNCENRGEPTPDVQWYLNGKKLPETGPEYFSMSRMSPGEYKCVIRNNLGSRTKLFNVYPRDCYIDTDKLTNSHALLLAPNLEWLTFEESEKSIIFTKGDPFILFCPSRFKTFSKKHITAFCDGGSNMLINGKKYDYFDIPCEEEVKYTIKKTRTRCMSRNTEKISIGYNVIGSENAEVYEVCFDKTREIPIYAKHTLKSPLTNYEFELPEKNNEKFQFNLEEAYDCPNQIKTISSLLGRWFHKDDGCCFKPRQLVNPEDVFPGAPATATFSYYNYVPHWSSCNDDNWREIERRVRSFARETYSDLEVWTGAAKELSFKSYSGTTSHFFMDQNGNEQRVPMYLWKVIQDEAAASSLAIIQVNVPDLRPEDVDRYRLCTDQCESVDWMNNPDWHDVEKGYTYCCSLGDFVEAFGLSEIKFKPDMDALLTGETYGISSV